MARHWTKEEDEFIHAYKDVGDFIGSHDLGRRDSAIGPRVRKLQAAGGWDALTVEKMAAGAYHLAMSRRADWDEEDASICRWMLRNAPALIAMMEAGMDLPTPAQVVQIVQAAKQMATTAITEARAQ